MIVSESVHRLCPEVIVSEKTSVYVIGDSISAGMGTGIPCWPDLLDRKISLNVMNLAQAGAVVNDGSDQAEKITQPGSLVIVEIGGNDLLGKTTAAEFASALDTLIGQLKSDGHTILMFELPLFPFQNAFGTAQRRIAYTHEISLLPKCFFVKVLEQDGATLDGLHLSRSGHQALAELIAEIVVMEKHQ